MMGFGIVAVGGGRVSPLTSSESGGRPRHAGARPSVVAGPPPWLPFGSGGQLSAAAGAGAGGEHQQEDAGESGSDRGRRPVEAAPGVGSVDRNARQLYGVGERRVAGGDDDGAEGTMHAPSGAQAGVAIDELRAVGRRDIYGLACATGAASARAVAVRTIVGTIRVTRNIWLSSSGNDQMCTRRERSRTPSLGFSQRTVLRWVEAAR